MAELLGSGYVIEHCISAYADKKRDEWYRIYITDALKSIAENTARFVGGNTMKGRYFDMIHPEKIDNRSSEEIIDAVKALIKDTKAR